MKKIYFIWVLAAVLLTTASCNGKKKISELICRKWDLKDLKLSEVLKNRKKELEIEQKRLEKTYFEPSKAGLDSMELEEQILAKKAFPFKHKWTADASFIKFYPDGSFTQLLPYVCIIGKWKVDEEKQWVHLQLPDGSEEIMKISFVSEDSLAAKMSMHFKPNSIYEKSIYFDLDDCSLEFSEDWNYYNTQLSDPFSPVNMKWMTPFTHTPTVDELKLRLKEYVIFEEKLWEQRAENNHKFYADLDKNLYGIAMYKIWSRTNIPEAVPGAPLLYDEEGFMRMQSLLETEFSDLLNRYRYSNAKDNQEFFTNLRKELP